MSKVLIHSNSPWTCTGYGSQVAIMAPRLNETHQVAVSAFYGLQGGALDWNGIRVMPPARDAYGNDVIQSHARQHFGGDLRGGLVVSLIDVWVLNTALWRTMNVAAWCPVDHDPVPPRVGAFFEQTGAVPLAMSRFGERMLEQWNPLYVPHGIPTDEFTPRDQTTSREMLGLPVDAFIVGMVAANKGMPSRKSFSEAFQAFATFRETRKDAHLYLHTEGLGVAEGMNLPNLLAALNIPPSSVTFVDQYAYQCMPFNTERMSHVYSALDVLLSPSAGEGFGIPIIEAQACGVPVIVSDATAMSELCGAGWTIGGERVWTYQESWQHRPDLSELVWALGDAYERAGSLRTEAREFALAYDADRVVAEHFLPALAQAQERYAEREPLALTAVA